MNLNILGTDDLKNLLSKLSPNIRDKILIKALQKISKPIINSAKTGVIGNQVTGRLYRSLGEVVNKKTLQITLGARKTGKYKGWHAHLLENGTTERQYITKKGNVHKTGKVKGIKFWESAITQNENKTQELGEYIIQSLEKEVDRMYKKVNKL